jgi:hypothetical protein
MRPTRPFPRRVFLPDWIWQVAFLATIAGSFVFSTPWFVVGLFLLAMVQGIYVFHGVCCPTCRGRLKFHQAPIPYTTRYRFQLACPHCQVVWDTGKISDDRTH